MKTGLILSWLAVTAVTTLVAWQIVAAADKSVSDPLPAAIEAGTQPPAVETTHTTTPLETTSTTRISSASLPSTEEPDAQPTSTTSPSASVTSNPEAKWLVRTFQTAGGSVVVTYSGDQVRFHAASPNPSYVVEIEDEGPPRVKVEFESATESVEIEIRRRDGAWDIDTSS